MFGQPRDRAAQQRSGIDAARRRNPASSNAAAVFAVAVAERLPASPSGTRCARSRGEVARDLARKSRRRQIARIGGAPEPLGQLRRPFKPRRGDGGSVGASSRGMASPWSFRVAHSPPPSLDADGRSRNRLGWREAVTRCADPLWRMTTPWPVGRFSTFSGLSAKNSSTARRAPGQVSNP